MSDISDRLASALADRYTIERELGAGGMATVYLAHDIKHDRKVAVKVLRPELGAVLGTERFLNEIKVTANLSHPHILPLLDSGIAEEPPSARPPDRPSAFLYYVMPFVEGESLRDKLSREKQLSIEESIEIAKSVASALDYAHRQNVIHRDIKPENILLHDGQPVVADFGISLAVSAAGGTRLTETGLSLGTPQYMSPEQATGDREVDGRSDIYSLACVLYEMLSGEPPHTGPTVQAVIAKVVTDRPRPIGELRDTVPNQVAASLHQALAKLPADRFADAAEFSRALATPSAVSFDTVPYEAGGAGRLSVGEVMRKPAVWGVLALVLIVGIGLGWWLTPSTEPFSSPVRFLIEARPWVELFASGPKVAVSPDGRDIVYVGDDRPLAASNSVANRMLYRRSLDALEVVPLQDTEGASLPCFSPDGRWIAFLVGDALMRVAVTGGPSEKITDVAGRAIRGISWGEGDVIVYARDGVSGLVRMDADGQSVDTIFAFGSENVNAAFRWPEIIPGGQAALVSKWAVGPDSAVVGVLDFEMGVFTPLIIGVRALSLGSGNLAIARQDGSLLVASYDHGTLSLGQSVPVVDGVRSYFGGAAQFAISRGGTLVYQSIQTWHKSLVLVDRSGTYEQWPISRNFWWANSPRVSPDGDLVVLTVAGVNDADLWIYDVRGQSISEFANEGTNQWAHWSSDGRELTFQSTRRRVGNIYRAPIDGSRSAELLIPDSLILWTSDWAPDGQTLAYVRLDPAGSGYDILTHTSDGYPASRPFIDSEHDERTPAISPNGRWIAYVSDESGIEEVYVRPFPQGGRQVQVSTGGGAKPVWAPDGRELFFVRNADFVSARVVAGEEFRVLERTTLFSGDFVASGFDVMPDGDHFLMILPHGERPSELVVVTDFLAEVEERLAALAGES